MKVETFTSAILRKISGTGKVEQKFIVHMVYLYLSMRGKLNYLMMWRYGWYNELTYRRHFNKGFDFKALNKYLIDTYCGKSLMWIFDPSYIRKSGKGTPGVGYFWSGSAGSVKWGLELSSLAVADMDNHTAMHYHSTQTQYVKGEDSLRVYYAKLICDQAQELQKTSKVIAFDAFFSKKPFVDRICEVGFTMISRLQHNVYLRYAHIALVPEQKKGKGRPKMYAGKIDLKNPSLDHCKIIKSDEDEIVYECKAHVRCLKRWCKLVIVHTLKDGYVHRAFAYFSTDNNMAGLVLLEGYRMRYQIEFLFRDAKSFIGLEDSQSRQEKALNFHFNLTFFTLNIAKVFHWFSQPKQQRTTFSMADIKTQYVNELILDRLISIYGKDPSVEKNNPQIKKLYELGRIAA